MQFNSYIFILLFMPAVFILYFLGNKIGYSFGKIILIIGSAIFYIYGGWQAAVLLAASILVNYCFSLCISKVKRCKKAFLAIDIVINVALLLYFKYSNFFITNVNQLLDKDYQLKELILPLGISFFSFQQIMYVVNIYKENIHLNFVDYLLYILYFPKILMGPLADPADIIQKFNDKDLKRVNWENVTESLKIFSFGLFKKLVIADTFAKGVAWGYSNIDGSTSMDWILITLFYTFQIYFDFSGYCDMAVGVSRLLNIDLPINFDSPYKALSIRDFWKRWHMTLTGFLTKYVYIPLGGSKRGRARTYINTMIVFIVSGIWHGANWTFILWGILHGAFSIFDRLFDKVQSRLSEVVRWFSTFTVVNLLWLLFRSESITQWLELLKKIFTFQDMSVSDNLIGQFKIPETSFLFDILHLENIDTAVRGLPMLIFIVFSMAICLIPENNYRSIKKNNVVIMAIAAVAFVWGILCLGGESVFVYFNF